MKSCIYSYAYIISGFRIAKQLGICKNITIIRVNVEVHSIHVVVHRVCNIVEGALKSKQREINISQPIST